MNDSAAAADKPFAGKEYDRLPWHVYVLGGVIILIGLATFILMSIEGETRDGYLYLFFYSIPANTAISVFPHEPILIYYGKFANLWYTTLAATGGTIVAGWLDQRALETSADLEGVVNIQQHGANAIASHGTDAVSDQQPAFLGLQRRAAVAHDPQFPRIFRLSQQRRRLLPGRAPNIERGDQRNAHETPRHALREVKQAERQEAQPPVLLQVQSARGAELIVQTVRLLQEPVITLSRCGRT